MSNTQTLKIETDTERDIFKAFFVKRKKIKSHTYKKTQNPEIGLFKNLDCRRKVDMDRPVTVPAFFF